MTTWFATEWREVLHRIGLAPARLKAVLVHLFLLGSFGGLLPWLKGVEFMDPALPTIYACLGPFFAAPVVIQMLREGYPGAGATLGRILAATLYGELFAIGSLAAGFATVLLTRKMAYLYLPDPVYLAKALLMGLGATLALASLAGWITLHLGKGWAMALIRVVFLVLLVIFVLRSWWLPSYTGTGSLLGFAVALIFLALLRRAPARS